MGIRQRAHLGAAIVDERLPRQPSVLDRLTKQLRPRIGSRDRHLDCVGIDVTGEANRLLDCLLRLPRQPQNERTVNLDAERLRVPSKPPSRVETNALLHVVQDHLIAGLVPNKQQTETVVLQHLQRVVGDIRLGVARPRHAELAETSGQSFDPRQVVGERVVIEEIFPDL